MVAAIAVVLVGLFVYLPWLIEALWLTARFRRLLENRGRGDGLLAGLVVVAVFCALAFILPSSPASC